MSVVVAGVGMHPWGKWRKNFVEYGVVAARAALKDAGIPWQDLDLIVGGETVRNGYAGYVAGATFAQALDTARARILAGLSEVALVVGADTTPKGFLAPNAGERWDDPDWLRFRLLGMTNPAYFALYARRRMDLYGATSEDFAAVQVKNSKHGLANPNARYRKEVSVTDVVSSAVVCDPLHLRDICATSDGGAAVILCSEAYAKKHGLDGVTLAAISTVTPTFPNTVMDMPAPGGGDHHRWADPDQPQRRVGVLRRGSAGAGTRPGLRAHLAAARHCREPTGRGARVGITANQGLFGHGSAVLLTR